MEDRAELDEKRRRRRRGLAVLLAVTLAALASTLLADPCDPPPGEPTPAVSGEEPPR